jgi:putative IMPACT (imprinted ancient) family translation regulator
MRIEQAAEAVVVVERSKFFALALPARGEDDVLAAVRAQKSKHRKAVHHCWALRVRSPEGALLEKSKDDGEVGHPGRVMLEQLRRAELEGALVVTRVFGGVKLGVGGVSRAFRQAADAVLSTLPRP